MKSVLALLSRPAPLVFTLYGSGDALDENNQIRYDGDYGAPPYRLSICLDGGAIAKLRAHCDYAMAHKVEIVARMGFQGLGSYDCDPISPEQSSTSEPDVADGLSLELDPFGSGTLRVRFYGKHSGVGYWAQLQEGCLAGADAPRAEVNA